MCVNWFAFGLSRTNEPGCCAISMRASVFDGVLIYKQCWVFSPVPRFGGLVHIGAKAVAQVEAEKFSNDESDRGTRETPAVPRLR
jgi:hypothetical protein